MFSSHPSRLLSCVAVILAIFAMVIPASVQSQSKYWIEFRDKGIDTACFHPGEPEFEHAKAILSQECLRRRSHEMGMTELQTITLEDAPVSSAYLQSLADIGIETESISRWSNAASACLLPAQIALVRSLPFVRRIDPVAHAEILSAPSRPAVSSLTALHHPATPESDSSCGYDPIIYHYGYAQSQLDRINVPPLHAMGLDATGVRLGFLDSGFRWRDVATLRTRHILSEYDYVFHDSVTANQAEDDPGQDNHGTSTFSTAMGYEPDSLIGPAYNASVYLAKTEDIRSERNIEEDNYAAALEDMEAAGVDVTTSSIGYFTFDSGQHSYTYADMNGHTSIVARAVERAAKLGVLVVTAMGNNGADTIYSRMITPADADSIISVGALSPDNSLKDFSARGPTSDGRMKPEICAPGVSVWVQQVTGEFKQESGTSFATPLTSSACCLIKQAHPEATAQQIRRAVMLTGDNARHPDTALGWGRLNAYAAALELGTIIHIKHIQVSGSTAQFCVAMADTSGIDAAFILYHTDLDSTTQAAPLSLVTDSLIYSVDLLATPGAMLYYHLLAFSNAGVATLQPQGSLDSVFIPGTKTIDREQNGLIVMIQYRAAGGIILTTNMPVDWRLFDVTAHEVQSGSVGRSTLSTEINTSAFSNGKYYLRAIASSGQSAVVQVAVLH